MTLRLPVVHPAQIHADHRPTPTSMENFLENRADRLVRPAVLAALAYGIALWIAINLLAPAAGYGAFDPPPFPWLIRVLIFLGLTMGSIILANCRRAARLAEQREHTTLELARATERKVARVLDLVEELRRNGRAPDSGSDPEARPMSGRTGRS